MSTGRYRPHLLLDIGINLALVSRARNSEHYSSPIVIARSPTGDEAISPGFSSTARDCFASLAMTGALVR